MKYKFAKEFLIIYFILYVCYNLKDVVRNLLNSGKTMKKYKTKLIQNS